MLHPLKYCCVTFPTWKRVFFFYFFPQIEALKIRSLVTFMESWLWGTKEMCLFISMSLRLQYERVWKRANRITKSMSVSRAARRASNFWDKLLLLMVCSCNKFVLKQEQILVDILSLQVDFVQFVHSVIKRRWIIEAEDKNQDFLSVTAKLWEHVWSEFFTFIFYAMLVQSFTQGKFHGYSHLNKCSQKKLTWIKMLLV